jgi:hypothetical protein
MRTSPSNLATERGMALITSMLVMLLMSALMISFTAVIMSDQRYRTIDRDRGEAFYAAHSGLEKLNAELATLFFANVAPSTAQIGALADDPPEITGVTFLDEGAGAYGVQFLGESSGQISTGPYEGLIALKRTYELSSGVRTKSGGSAQLRRKVETVAIPVFQFGMFSEVDLSFSAADDFDFGGRVHTNGNLYLAQGGASGSTLWLRDRVTAVGQIVRKRLSNGESIAASGSIRTVRAARAPNSFRNLLESEGSVLDGRGSGPNPAWPTISLSTYNAYLRTGTTGARRLDLPLITSGGATVDLIRRPASTEDTTNPTLLAERYFTKVSLRILLSDTQQDITSLPTVTNTPPVALEGDWLVNPPNNGTAYGPPAATRPPVALSPGLVTMALNEAASITVGANRTIRIVGGIPNVWLMPALTFTAAGTNYTMTCSIKASATRVSGCIANPIPAAAVAVPAGTAITAIVDGVPTTTTTTGTFTIAAGTGATGNVDVASTLALSRNTLWVDGTNNLVTCAGYDTTLNPQRFQACNVSATIAANASLTTSALSNAGVSTIGGFIKIERQDPAGNWQDVTMEILNWGIAGGNLSGKACGDPTPNAILRIQRLRDNNEAAAWPGVSCSYSALFRPVDYWPNVLFDAREAVFRDTAVGTLRLGGVMHYIALDADNLSEWFAGAGVYAGGTGPNSRTDNGFSVYFSDRRNNRNAAGDETGEYGFEDVVNPGSAIGTPNGVLDDGEDFNGNGTLETYGQFPVLPAGAIAPLDGAARPTTGVTGGVARVNRAVLFRRALKLINGGLGNIVMPGLTVVSENPVYVQGDWNASQAGFGAGNANTSIVTDAVTLLSNNWNDSNSFASPYAVAGRPRGSHTWYRFAVIAGKGRIFPRPNNGEGATFGTDGGVHSFLRFLEGSGGDDTIHYMGSMATFFFNRQAVSPFKCCGGVVYAVPTRDYRFDVSFLDPAKLPPLTPVFRDLNSLGFTQTFRDQSGD